MRALPFLIGLVAATVLAVAAGWGMGWSAGWLVVLALAVLGLGQVLYLGLVALMVRAEAARRRAAAPQDVPSKDPRNRLPQHEN